MTAMRTLRFIEANFDVREDEDLTQYFKPEALQRVLDDSSDGSRLNNQFIVDTVITDTIEVYFYVIVDGMNPEDLREEDFEALRRGGSQNPKQEIHLSMIRLKRKKEILIRQSEKCSITYTIKNSVEHVTKRKKRIEKANANNPPKKKIFKGLSSICKGAMLTIVDVSLVTGM